MYALSILYLNETTIMCNMCIMQIYLFKPY